MRIKMAEDTEVRIKRFAKLSSDSVAQATQNLDIQTSKEVSSALVDDVSFRVRQITDAACQFMHHAKRKKLLTEDFDKALKWSRVEPLHGHHTGQPTQFIQDAGVYSLQDEDLELSDVAMATPVSDTSLPDPPHVEACWLSIEGAPVNRTNDGAGEMQSLVELKRDTNEANERYMSVLMEALTGDKEDLRRIALTDLQKNPAIANILPDIILYLQETLGDWAQFTPQQLLYLLKLSLALFHNSNLFLDPYLPAVYPTLKAILLDSSYLAPVGDHWAVREMAAAAMAGLLRRCESQLNDSLSDLHSSFHQVLTSPDPPLPTVYGAVVTLCYLAGDSLVKVLYPHMEDLLGHLQGLLEGNLPTAIMDDVLRIYEALLLGAELLLTGGYQLEESHSSSPPPVKRDPTPAEPQPPLPKETNSLFASTSFSLSTESTDMEIETNVTATNSKELATKNEERTPSLYNHLIEMFGEKLSLRLSSNPQFITPPTSLSSSQQQTKDTSHKRQAHTSRSLLTFLSEEGFKSSKVELPLASLPPSSRGNQWTLNVPKTRLPVNGNILEQKSRQAKHQSRHKKEQKQSVKLNSFNKGVSPSYRRHNSKSGLENVGAQSAWL